MFSVATFQDWLLSELKERDWSQADLARKSGLSRGTVSLIISQNRQPGLEAATGIARAFGYSVDFVLQRVQSLPPVSEDDALIEQINNDLNRLSEPRRKLVMDFVRFLATQQSTEGGNEEARP